MSPLLAALWHKITWTSGKYSNKYHWQVNYSFGAYGSYDVTLTVVDITGVQAQKTVNYYGVNTWLPTFQIVPGNCINKQVSFNDSSVKMVFPLQNGPGIWDGTQQTLHRHLFTCLFANGNLWRKSPVKNSANCRQIFDKQYRFDYEPCLLILGRYFILPSAALHSLIPL